MIQGYSRCKVCGIFKSNCPDRWHDVVGRICVRCRKKVLDDTIAQKHYLANFFRMVDGD